MKYKDIPAYFHNSELYRSFGEDDIDDEIDVPRKYTSYSKKVSSTDKLISILELSQYWGFDELPEEFHNFFEKNIESSLLYFTENINPKTSEELSKFLNGLEPKTYIQIYLIYKLRKKLNLDLRDITSYILLNKESWYLFKKQSEYRSVCEILDGINCPFMRSINPIIKDDSYYKILYKNYTKEVDVESESDTSFIDEYLLKKLEKIPENYRSMKISYPIDLEMYEFKSEQKIKKPEVFNTIFEHFLSLCIEHGRYLFEYEGTKISIIDSFVNNKYEYNPDVLFNFQNLKLYDKNEDIYLIYIRNSALLISYLIYIEEPTLLDYLKKIKWSKIEPKNLEDEGDFNFEGDEWIIRSLKYEVSQITFDEEDED